MLGIGRLYTVEFHAVAITAQQDLFYIKPAADKLCFIEMVKLAVSGASADAGDTQEELFDISLLRVPTVVTASAAGNAATPTPISFNDAAASFTARTNDTTKATSTGTILNLDSDGMNSRVPYIYLPAPEHRLPVANPNAIVCRLNTTPADSILMSGTMLVRELP